MLVLGSTPGTSQVTLMPATQFDATQFLIFIVFLLMCEMQDDFGFGYIDGKQWEQFVLKFSAPPSPPNRFLLLDARA
jgi:hypothetical protein